MDVDEVSTGPVCGGPVQMDPGVVALSRCRRTIVVVRQFSLVAISRIHPMAGIRCGWARVPVCDPVRAFCMAGSGSGVLMVVMAWSPVPRCADTSPDVPHGTALSVSLLSVDGARGRTGGSTGESEPVDTFRGRMRVLTDTSA